ncbi:UDP-glucose:glycoprotein glucosyltransferase 2 [Bagarius yarrelli]|uniref:UDP-glucose ceramide glucosyltransferase-like 1 n=1 Tax=Bagarius yarrelli TaxID=175774 RepID=A0A556UFM5_BAGYA|nr:UDP-glucose:glycoprotein glucosyltransferase 2 [Bagarius yarrelli]
MHPTCVSLNFIASDNAGLQVAACPDAVAACTLCIKGSHSQSEGQVAHDSTFTGDKVKPFYAFSEILSEFISEGGDDTFWQFVDTVKELKVYKHGESVRSYYHLIIKKAGQFLSDLQVSLLKFALSLRAYSPAVHAFQQLASDEPPPDACSAFVSVHGLHACSTKDMKKLLKGATDRPKPYLYKSDHKYPGVNGTDLPIVLLYAEIGTKQFNTFHKVLIEKAREGKLIYVLRHFISKPTKQHMLLSGYGVELAIKSTEYKAVDDTQVKDLKSAATFEEGETDDIQGFLFGKLRESHPELKEQLGELRKHLLESMNDLTPLKVWELQDLSFQAAAQIMSVPKLDSLQVMRDLSQNFPSKARLLTRVAVNEELRKEIEENQQRLSKSLGLHPGDTSLYINGMHIDLDLYNPFSILDIIREEAKLLEGLYNLGIKGTTLGKFLCLPVSTAVDTYALDIRHSAIMWVNDIETDSTYRNWPSSIQELLRATFPGVIRQIRRNFFNLVLFLDPVQEDSIKIVKLAELFYKHKIPLRIGFVFVINEDEKVGVYTDAGVAFFRVFNYLSEEYDITQAFLSMVSIYKKVNVGDSLSVDTVTAYIKKKFPKANLAKILGVDTIHDYKRKAGAIFYRECGLGALPVGLFNGVPLSAKEMDPDKLETSLLQHIMDATNFFQNAAFMGRISEDTDVVDFLMEQPNVVPRINPLILSSDRRYLDFTASPVVDDWDDFTMFSFLDSKDKTAVVSKRMKYLTKNEEATVFGVTFWIVVDLERASGRQILLNALKHMKSGGFSSRVGVIINPSGPPTEDSSNIYRAIWASFLTQSTKNTLDFTLKLLKEESVQLLSQGTKIKDLLLKILGPFAEEEELSIDDFHLLEKLTLSTLADKIMAKVKQMSLTPQNASDLIMKVDALLSAAPKTETRKDITFVKDKHSVLHLSPREDEVFIDVAATVDPLTRDAQKLAPLLIVSGVVNAEYELEYLLLEGHCFDHSTGQPPRGLQFTLGKKQEPLMHDTIVMANLGYFQLKANPGAWILRLRNGRSEDIYQIHAHDGTDSPADAKDVIVMLDSFNSKIIKVRVQKKPAKFNEDLLSESSETEGLWDSITSLTGVSSVKEGNSKKEDVLNIFSVASGHLYERFLRIMMLSVLEHTKTPVKFWFLQNYLSPSFKAFIPHMAEAYGFQYELVQYKWPRWLHQQTEKQRIIWGYKILFLDVLFPLAVDKIIFVDADQIVRADLKELRDIDLEGAPYGYTPFCDSRDEMDGYRFWKTGYWASHLGHRKYHISALYVVDLKKFRKIAAGDRLRGQYQALSQDPNSLSNLDQDLPNNMIHQVAIKSLPQDWLWCETWCDHVSKANAKTIDLCNNPKTKEPKISAAVRIVPEWTRYDNQIKMLLKQVEDRKENRKRAALKTQHTKQTKEEEEEEGAGKLPLVLSCGHVFCSDCLRSLARPQASGSLVSFVSCPDCSRQDLVRNLNNTLIKASENLNTLDSLHQVYDGLLTSNSSSGDLMNFFFPCKTLVTGIQAQLKKERNRIIKEINNCMEKAISILQQRRSVLVSQLSCLEELFSEGKKECQKLHTRQTELCTTIQKARHVCRVPLLETYCHLDTILETLQRPVDTNSYDMSCLNLRSDLRVHKDVAIPPATEQPVKSGVSAERKGGRESPQPPRSPHPATRKHIRAPSPDFVIEEIIEETVDYQERDVMAPVFVKLKHTSWYRAIVDQVVQKGCLEAVTHCSASDVAHLEVFFPDHGFSKELDISGDGLNGLNECVRIVDTTAQADLQQWAPQAIRCSLKDIVPSDLIKGWSREASEEMKHVIGSSLVEMQVLGEERDTLLVDLKKVSISLSLSLREHLVFMELARFYSPQRVPASTRTMQFYPPVFPKLNTQLKAVVSHVNTPSDFYIQLVDNMEFLLLNTKLQTCYGPVGAESDLQIYVPVLSQACVALYDNMDWCRAQVTGFPDGQKVEVQYVDFGNKEMVSVKDLRQIKNDFFSLPAMALHCSLDGFSSVGETWSEESIDMFRKLTEQKLVTVVSESKYKYNFINSFYSRDVSCIYVCFLEPVLVSMALPVCLFEVSDSTEFLSSIGEILVTKGLAALSTQGPPIPLEHTVWDPPLIEEDQSHSEPLLPNLEPSKIQPNLTLPDFLKDVKVKVTHVASPGYICVQLLQYDTQLNRPAPKPDSLGETKAVCKGGQKIKLPAPYFTSLPKPAPRTSPPPQRVKTQAYLPPELPPCGHACMNISAVSDNGVIHIMTLQAACEFQRLQEQLQQHIKTLPRQKHYNWKNVLGCVVMGSDMLWYRGEVQNVIGSYLKVRYVDQGTLENIPVCHVYPKVLCENISQLSVPCKLNKMVSVFLSVLDIPDCEQEMDSLDEALDRLNLMIDSLTCLTDFPIDGPCLAKYSDGRYYRAKILDFSRLKPSIQFLVRHVDFGSDDVLPLSKLRCLPKSLLHFPCQAVCVQLAGFKAPHQCQETERISYSPEWSMKAMLEMIALLHGKFHAVVMAVQPQPAVLLYNEDGTLVHTPLVDKGLAE